MRVSVVIPTLNSARTIEACIRSFLEQTSRPHEIIIVDGGSVDGTQDTCARYDVSLILNVEHTPGGSRNLGAKAAGGDIFYFCDSDCVADARSIEYHLKSYIAMDIAGVMGSIRNASPENPVSAYVQRLVLASEWNNNIDEDGMIKRHLTGANFSIYKEDFLSEKFNEELTSNEDIELLFRLRKNGKKIIYEPRSFVYHPHPKNPMELFNRYRWYGAGLFQLCQLYGDVISSRYELFSPKRYLEFDLATLEEAVSQDNRMLCIECPFNPIQGCGIKNMRILDDKDYSELNLHRIICLGVASGILDEAKKEICKKENFTLN